MRKRVLLYGQGIYMRRGWISFSYSKCLRAAYHEVGLLWARGPVPVRWVVVL